MTLTYFVNDNTRGGHWRCIQCLLHSFNILTLEIMPMSNARSSCTV